MILADFLEPLAESGRPVFDSPDPPRDLGKPAERTILVLKQIEQRRRLEAPGTAPRFELPIAHSLSVALCRLAQFTVFREIPAETIDTEWNQLRPTLLKPSPSASETWSADIALSYLPNLFLIARNVAENDPLIRPICDLAKHWPLSGIGISGIEWKEEDFLPILSHSSLSALLFDRIFERKDRTAASFPKIREQLETSVGGHAKLLAPWLADL